jgi:trimeric autotransporter adhesin
MNRFLRALASSRPLHHASAGLAVTLFAVAVGADTLRAQSPRPRITAPVDDSVRITLPNSVPALARAEYDLGEEPASTPMKHVQLLLSRAPEQQARLERDLQEIEDKSSPSYHKWLRPEQFGARYGAAEADIAAVGGWLESQGLSGIAVPKARTTIEFSGSVGLIEQVFHTSIHSFRRGGEEFIANLTDASIPAAFAPVIAGIVHLNTIEPRSFLVPGPSGHYDAASKRLVPVDKQPATGGAQPLYTGTLQGAPFLYLGPADAATMYNTPNSKLNANFGGGASYDGAGVTIGIVGDGAVDTTIVANYRKLFLGDTKVPTVTNVDCCDSTNGQNEAYLDTEVSGALAPGASLHLYLDSSIPKAITAALDDNTIDILNVSFGICEKNAGTENQILLGDWQQASMQGIAVVTASGDSGSAACDSKDNEEASDGLAVSGYTSTPYDISVGGTDTWGLVGDYSTYASSTNTASDFYRTLLKPIPESVWNDWLASPGPIATATATRMNINGGGGGASSCSTQSDTDACISGYAKPSWQSGAGVPNDGVRDVPDVALMAGPGYDSAAWLLCSVDNGECTAETTGGFSFGGVGGTSAAAPAFAGMLAMVQQKTGDRLGQAVGELYTLYRSFGSRIFNDITLGNNAPPCYAPTADLPSPNCVKNKAGNYFESAYNAGPGYDRASGLGSVNATNLVEFWGAGALSAATVTVKPASSTIFRGDSLTVEVSVSGSGGTPTGKVTLSGGGFKSAAAALSGAKVEIRIPANALAAGSDTLTASYSGDSKLDSASSTAKITVTLLTPTVTVKPASASVSRAKSLEVSVTVAAEKATLEGTVTLSGPGYTSPATALAGGKAHITIPAGKLTAGRDKLTVAYHGAADFKASTGDAVVTVTKAATAVTVKPAVANMPKTVSLNVTVKVTSAAGTPTGTVTLVSGSYRSVATRLTRGEAVVTIPAGKLAVGKDTLSASYSGSLEDATATGKATVTVSQ